INFYFTFFNYITYCMVYFFRNFIEEVQETSESRSKTLSIVLRTPGGSAETVERYVTVVRKHYDTVNFIVPDMAMSAGTIWCMSGDKIFMDYSSSLGPIDPQVLASDNSGYVAALGYLDKVKQITEQEQLSQADVVFLKSLDLAKLALYEQARDLSVDLLKKWLVQYKFKNWAVHRTNSPGNTVTIQEKELRAEEIAKDLADHKKWRSHGRALNIEKLKELRLEIDDYSGHNDLGNAIRAYNDLLTAYNDRMGQKFYLHSHLVKDSI
ncbi:MAG: hypothetical protein K2X09_02290, partial [Rickettsiales bacterium]|nr:hypothetical protein [Rickettsiales bacterium]